MHSYLGGIHVFQVHVRNAAIKSAQQRFSKNNDLVVKPRLAGDVLISISVFHSHRNSI